MTMTLLQIRGLQSAAEQLARSLLQVPELEGTHATKCLSEQDAGEPHHGNTAIPVLSLWGEDAGGESFLACVTPARYGM